MHKVSTDTTFYIVVFSLLLSLSFIEEITEGKVQNCQREKKGKECIKSAGPEQGEYFGGRAKSFPTFSSCSPNGLQQKERAEEGQTAAVAAAASFRFFSPIEAEAAAAKEGRNTC